MHLLANARRQNVACDGCRAKKVKCGRESIEEKISSDLSAELQCPQCIVKGTECTSVYVESIQNKPPLKRPRRTVKENGNAEAGPSRLPSRGLTGSDKLDSGEISRSRSPSAISPPSASQSQEILLRFLFSAEAVRHHEMRYSDLPDIALCRSGNSDLWENQQGQVYAEEPSEAHRNLHGQAIADLAIDLLETYASIIHIRFPILDIGTVRARFSQPDSHPAGPLTHALLAVLLAFGARFSDHPAIASDKEDISSRDTMGGTRSRIVQLLVLRAREVCEAQKIHRIVSEENCVTLHLLEYLLGTTKPVQGVALYYAHMSGRQAVSLGLTDSGKVSIRPDEAERMREMLMWWIIGQSDGWLSLFSRTKPMFDDDDFRDMELSTLFGQSGSISAIVSSMKNVHGHPAGLQDSAQDPTLLYFTSSSAYASICRRLYHDLYGPLVKRKGISTVSIRNFVHLNSEWHDKYISNLGVPETWPDQWNFHSAISSCTTDAYHHVLWIIVNQAIQDVGLEDEKKNGRSINTVELGSLKRRIAEESERSSLRIASLVNVLTENGYLRLDPMILFHPIYMAGVALAKTGRAECQSCIAGLRQYSIAYGHMWDSANEIERIYQSSIPAAHGGANSLDGLGLELWLPPHAAAEPYALPAGQTSGWVIP